VSRKKKRETEQDLLSAMIRALNTVALAQLEKGKPKSKNTKGKP